MIDELTTGLNGINLAREGPPPLDQPPPIVRPTSIIQLFKVFRISLLSEGHYARDPDQRIVFREPRMRENIQFSGDSKLLRKFF